MFMLTFKNNRGNISPVDMSQRKKAPWYSWLVRRPVTPTVTGSSPVGVVFGRIAQLGEHLPYKQGVTGSSPVATSV